MSRDAILGRIRAAREAWAAATPRAAGREALAAGIAAIDAPPPLPAPQHFADAVGFFTERARQVGVRVDAVASPTGVADRVVGFCGERNLRRAAVWSTPEMAPVVDRLQAIGVQIVAPGSGVDDVASADVGVTGAAWGIAETSTLVLPSGPQQPRLASLLPPVHVAVLRADRILPDLHALFSLGEVLPSGLTFITGPSRSADIGLTPVLGAHGPMEVYVVLMVPS